MKILLVTGQRALAESPQAVAWVRHKLREELPGCVVLVHGACPDSPDAWAEQEYRKLPPQAAAHVKTVCTTGVRAEHHVDASRVIACRATGEMIQTTSSGEALGNFRWKDGDSFLPLYRNGYMARLVKSLTFRIGSTPISVEKECLAFTCSWSKSGGTYHAIRQAQQVGIAVTEFRCPDGFEPELQRDSRVQHKSSSKIREPSTPEV